jgi:hypothetical protein
MHYMHNPHVYLPPEKKTDREISTIRRTQQFGPRGAATAATHRYRSSSQWPLIRTMRIEFHRAPKYAYQAPSCVSIGVLVTPRSPPGKSARALLLFRKRARQSRRWNILWNPHSFFRISRRIISICFLLNHKRYYGRVQISRGCL